MGKYVPSRMLVSRVGVIFGATFVLLILFSIVLHGLVLQWEFWLGHIALAFFASVVMAVGAYHTFRQFDRLNDRLSKENEEFRQTRNALSESQVRLRAIFENALDAILLGNDQAVLVEVNPAACSLLGYNREELLQMKIWELIPEPEKTQADRFWEEFLTKGQISGRFSIVRKDGHPIEVDYRAIANILPGLHLSVLRDVSEQTQAQRELEAYRDHLEELVERRTAELNEMVARLNREVARRIEIEKVVRESEEKYRSLFDHIPIGLYRTNEQGEILEANPALCELLGYSRQELIREINARELFVDLEEREREIDLLERDGLVRGFEMRMRRRDGNVIWVWDSAHAIRDSQGNVLYYEGSLEDITERKQAEEALNQRARELQALYQTTLEINTQPDLMTMLRSIVKKATELIKVSTGGLYILQPDGQSLQLVVAYNMPDEMIGVRLGLGEGLSGRAALRGETLMVEDYSQWEGRSPLFEKLPLQRTLSVPLKVRGKVIGVISVNDEDRVGPFSSEEIRLVSMFADQAAIAIENARLYEQAIQEIAERQRAEQAEHEQRKLAEALHDVASALNSTLDLEEVLDRILDNVTRVLPCEAANLMLVENDVAHIVRHRGYKERGLEDYTNQLRFSIHEITNLIQMDKTGQPVVIPDVHHYPGWVDLPQTRWIRSYMGAPIRVKGQTVGFINLDSAEVGFYKPEDARRLQAFADQAAIAIENARLFDEVQRHARSLSLLNDITRTAVSAINVKSMLQDLVDLVSKLMETDTCYITLWDENEQKVIPAAASGALREEYPRLKIEPGELTMTASVLQAGHTLIAEDVLNSPYISPRIVKFPTRSLLGVPLIADGKPLGALLVGFDQPHSFSQYEIDLSEQVAHQVALVIMKAKLYEELQHMAITDVLTGLYNRRGLFLLGEREIERALRYNRPLSALMLDLDHFKQVNDVHGHAIGDQVLCEISQRCLSLVREVDLVSRYGGDEFVLLLSENNLEAACMVAERLREAVAINPIKTEAGEISITASVGVAQANMKTPNLDALIKNADDAMYIAKNSGRNRVMVKNDKTSC